MRTECSSRRDYFASTRLSDIAIKRVFGSVVVVAFQIVFRAESMPIMFFHFLKIIFDISTSKRSKKYKPNSILAKKKISKFGEKQFQPHPQTGSKPVSA